MTNSDTFNLEDRILCSDDACIGLIGADGLCGECGRPDVDGGAPSPNGSSPFDHVEAARDSSEAAPLDSSPSSDEERVPCLDGTCIGILDGDGVCGTCGQLEA